MNRFWYIFSDNLERGGTAEETSLTWPWPEKALPLWPALAPCPPFLNSPLAILRMLFTTNFFKVLYRVPLWPSARRCFRRTMDDGQRRLNPSTSCAHRCYAQALLLRPPASRWETGASLAAPPGSATLRARAEENTTKGRIYDFWYSCTFAFPIITTEISQLKPLFHLIHHLLHHQQASHSTDYDHSETTLYSSHHSDHFYQKPGQFW